MFSSQGQWCVVLCQVLKSWNTKQSEQVCSVLQWEKLAETKVHTACSSISDAKFGSSISARCLHTFAAASDHHQDVLGAACEREREIQSKTVWQIFDAPVVLQLFPHPARPPGCKGWMMGGCCAWSTLNFAKKCKPLVCHQQRLSNMIVLNLNPHSGSLVCTLSVGTVAR